MTGVQRTGLALPLGAGLPVAGLVRLAVTAEQLGYQRVWAAEAGTMDAFGLLTACAGQARQVGLATGVVPIYTRPPALMAASAATLQDASGGRFTLGVGVSSRTVVADWNGLRYDHPLARVRDYLSVLRELLTGGKVTRTDGWYPVRGYRLLMPVPPAPPVLLAGLNPRMLALAGELADGALLNFVPAAAAAGSVQQVRRAAGERPVTVAAFVRVCVTDDPAAAGRWARREVMGYVTVPAYRRAFARYGWAAACDAALGRWQAGDRAGAAAGLPGELVDALCLAGTAADARARFAEFRAAGVDEPVAFPFTGATDPEQVSAELRATLVALAPGSATGAPAPPPGPHRAGPG